MCSYVVLCRIAYTLSSPPIDLFLPMPSKLFWKAFSYALYFFKCRNICIGNIWLLLVWVAPTIATNVGLGRSLPSHSKYVFFLVVA